MQYQKWIHDLAIAHQKLARRLVRLSWLAQLKWLSMRVRALLCNVWCNPSHQGSPMTLVSYQGLIPSLPQPMIILYCRSRAGKSGLNNIRHMVISEISTYQPLTLWLLSLGKSAENCGRIGGVELINHGRRVLLCYSGQPLESISIDSVLKAGDTV